MPFHYDPSPTGKPLLQGEILRDLWEYRSLEQCVPPSERTPRFQPIHHPLLVVLTSACDLEWDFEARQTPEPADKGAFRMLPFVLGCDLHDESTIKTQIAKGSDIWRRIAQNQDERYHHLPAAQVPDTEESLPDLFMDFSKTIAVPTPGIYNGIGGAAVLRVCVIADGYVHDLAQRYYAFQARVGMPD